MKILCKNSFVLLWFVCFGLVLTSESQAKVCFVGDPDCAQGAEFEEYTPPEGATLCKEEYGTLATECTGDMQISAYCPYDSSYVKCCSKEYVYDEPCVYPLITTGRCGNKYKCECDSTQYKFTDAACRTEKGSAGEGYENSYGAGSFCTQQRYDLDSHQIVSEVKFSSCQCDRGIYPKIGSKVPQEADFKSDCDSNAEKTGPCSTKYAGNNNTETYYKFCRCNTYYYPKTDAGCYPLTGDAKQDTCFDTIMHYKDCASCAGYNASSLEHVPYSPSGKAVRCEKDDKGNLVNEDCDYEVCPYDQTGNTYLKIRKCNEPGYKPNADKSACVPISCSEAVEQFITQDSDYGIFDGKNLRDADGNVTTKAKYGIVAGNVWLSSSTSCGTPVTTYKYECADGYCASNFNSLCMSYNGGYTLPCGAYANPDLGMGGPSTGITGPVTGVGTTSYFCCTKTRKVATGTSYPNQGYLGCSGATEYYSPAYIVHQEGTSTDGAKAMNVACTNAVSISASSYLNNSRNNSVKVSTYGVNWTLSGDVNKPMEIYNGKIAFSNAKIKAAMQLKCEPGKPNSGNCLATGSNNIASDYSSEGYDYNMSTFQVDNPSFNRKVLIKKGSKTTRVAFKATALKVKGLMAFYDSDIDVNKGYIGVHTWSTGHIDDCGSWGCGITNGSNITLYRSKYNLFNSATRYLYMGTKCFLGYGDKSSGSEITVRENGNDRVAYQIVHRYYHQRKNSGCGDYSISYLDGNGNIASTNLCWIDGYVEAKCKTQKINTGVCEFSSLAEHNLKNYINDDNTDYERNGCTGCRGGVGAYDLKDMWLYRY